MSENQTIVGGYELRNCVASGRTTQIWEVAEQGSTVQLAMKLMLDDARKKPELKAILKHEFKIGSQLDHPSIIRFHKIEVNRDHAFFTMDYFRAPNLKAQIGSNTAETQSRFKKIVEALSQGYAHLHDKGWLHCDIKPDNILVNKSGEIRIIDFSLTRRIVGGLGKLFAGKQKVIQGTRTYIPPEVILKRVPTIQSDIYSLGISLYEILTGSPPFAGLSPNDLLKKHLGETPAPPSSINPNVTSELDQIILKMLSKKPKERPADMREVHAAIRSLKCFAEDPLELHERMNRDAKEREKVSVDKRLDSRADADRSSQGLPAPARPKKSKHKTAGIGEIQASKKESTGKSGVFTGTPDPGMVPYGMPPQMMPHQMMPPQMMPPQMMPPQMMPPQMMPPQMMPHGGSPMAAATSFSAPQNITPPSASPQVSPAISSDADHSKKVVNLPLERRRAPTPTPDAKATEGLDFMTELPDIL